MTQADELKDILTNLDWSHYVDIVENISKINKFNIEDELVKSSRIYALYAGLYNLAKSNVAIAEMELDSFYHNARKALVVGSDKKIADNKLDSMVMSNTEYIKTKGTLEIARHKENLLKGLMMALDKRHENLIQLSSNHRAEMKLTS